MDGDNLAVGEILKLTFNKTVDILGFTVNDGHKDAATGILTGYTEKGGGSAFASDWDGVLGNGEDAANGALCGASSDFCGVTMFSLGSKSFTGYLESITVSVPSAVPLPAGSLLPVS